MSDNTQRSVEIALHSLEVEANNFAYRFIKDAAVRRNYMETIRQSSNSYLNAVKNGQIPAGQAAFEINQIRNDIMELSRTRSSDVGRAVAQSLKSQGKTLEELMEVYAQRRYSQSFQSLSTAHRNQIHLDIIESAGRSRPSVNAATQRLSRAGRALFVVAIGVAVYNVYTAEDKTQAIAREGVVLGGGFAGGAAGGAAAGLICGPGAPVCVTLGAFIGGALGAIGADLTFSYFGD